MFGGLSFLVVGLMLLFLSAVLFFVADKTELIDTEKLGNLPPLIDWSFLLLIIAIFCLLSEYMSFATVFLIMSILCGIAWILHYSYRKKHQEILEPLSIWHFIDYLRGFFLIFAVIFLLRSFLVDLSIIPSSSMRPGLVVGDFVLVDKFHYGIKLPITNRMLLARHPVARGDIIVFNYPLNRKIQYVKRVVGLPGDTVELKDKNLYINGELIAKSALEATSYLENSYNVQVPYSVAVYRYRQSLGNTTFNIYEIPNRPTLDKTNVKPSNTCQVKSNDYISCHLPPGKFFVLGDNRDNSEDGRYWGFVDEKDIQGRPFFVWMNFKDFSRIGKRVK
ncbi:MAG: signal peptidase I [Neisseriaceae bacterium]